jgi:tetratricopeptide (TPR) repeat protein
MTYLNFDLEIHPGIADGYPVTVRLEGRGGEAAGTLHLPSTTAIPQSQLPTIPQNEQAARAFGQALFDALLTGDIGKRYAASRVIARQENKGLRLRLHIQPPELAVLPWEYLYDKDEGNYVCLSRLTPLIRYLDLPRTSQPLAITLPLRILVMAASPQGLDQLDIAGERQRLKHALSSLEARHLVEMHWLEGQTWRDLQQALWDDIWHIFHFIGHGGFNSKEGIGMLALADAAGKLDLLDATQLGQLLKDQQALRLVLLSACEGAKASKRDIFSSIGAHLAQLGIPAVLAMQGIISDPAAIELASTLYEALAHGKPVDQAVTEARIAISVAFKRSLDWGLPVLYLRTSESLLSDFSPAARPAPPILPSATPAPPSPKKPRRRPTTPRNEEDWANEALALIETQHYDQALAACDEAIRLNPTFTGAYAIRGKIFEFLQRYQEALTSFDAAIQLEPAADLYTLRGRMLIRLGRHEEALAAFEQALRMELGDKAAAYRYKSETLLDLHRPEEALSAAEQAIHLGPSSAEGYYFKGRALSDLKRYEEALAALEIATQIAPANPYILNVKGNVLSMLKRHQESLAAYERAIQLAPTIAALHLNRARTLQDLKRYQEALIAARQAIQLDPTSGDAYSTEGDALKGLGRTGEAKQSYKKARDLGATI